MSEPSSPVRSLSNLGKDGTSLTIEAMNMSADKLFDSVDKDKSGMVDKQEFMKLHEGIVAATRAQVAREAALAEEKDLHKAESMKERAAKQKAYKLLGLAVGVVIFLLAMLGGMIVAINYAMKEQYVSTSTLTDASGNVLASTTAVVALPLIAAPVVPVQQLAQVEHLSVSYSADESADPVTLLFKISRVSLYNNTAVSFLASSGDTVNVINGQTYVTLTSGASYPICAADVSCSALTIEDYDAAEQLEQEARDALAAAGFSAPDRRQLARKCAAKGGGGEREARQPFRSRLSFGSPSISVFDAKKIITEYCDEAALLAEFVDTTGIDEAIRASLVSSLEAAQEFDPFNNSYVNLTAVEAALLGLSNGTNSSAVFLTNLFAAVVEEAPCTDDIASIVVNAEKCYNDQSCTGCKEVIAGVAALSDDECTGVAALINASAYGYQVEAAITAAKAAQASCSVAAIYEEAAQLEAQMTAILTAGSEEDMAEAVQSLVSDYGGDADAVSGAVDASAAAFASELEGLDVDELAFNSTTTAYTLSTLTAASLSGGAAQQSQSASLGRRASEEGAGAFNVSFDNAMSLYNVFADNCDIQQAALEQYMDLTSNATNQTGLAALLPAYCRDDLAAISINAESCYEGLVAGEEACQVCEEVIDNLAALANEDCVTSSLDGPLGTLINAAQAAQQGCSIAEAYEKMAALAPQLQAIADAEDSSTMADEAEKLLSMYFPSETVEAYSGAIEVACDAYFNAKAR
jgi:hypothetical protein